MSEEEKKEKKFRNKIKLKLNVFETLLSVDAKDVILSAVVTLSLNILVPVLVSASNCRKMDHPFNWRECDDPQSLLDVI